MLLKKKLPQSHSIGGPKGRIGGYQTGVFLSIGEQKESHMSSMIRKIPIWKNAGVGMSHYSPAIWNFFPKSMNSSKRREYMNTALRWGAGKNKISKNKTANIGGRWAVRLLFFVSNRHFIMKIWQIWFKNRNMI